MANSNVMAEVLRSPATQAARPMSLRPVSTGRSDGSAYLQGQCRCLQPLVSHSWARPSQTRRRDPPLGRKSLLRAPQAGQTSSARSGPFTKLIRCIVAGTARRAARSARKLPEMRLTDSSCLLPS